MRPVNPFNGAQGWPPSHWPPASALPPQSSPTPRPAPGAKDDPAPAGAPPAPRSTLARLNASGLMQARVGPASVPDFSIVVRAVPDDLMRHRSGVYGYLPRPGTPFAKPRWHVDWTSRPEVAQARDVRLDYHRGLQAEREVVAAMRGQGVSDEHIARHIVALRNETRLSKYSEAELPMIYARNLDKYGDRQGPAYATLLAKYGSPPEVIRAGLRSNPSMDILTGIGIVQ